MKKAALIAGLFLFLSTTSFAQSIDKTLAFAQIASGGVWVSIINVTNRGTTTYTGSLNFYTMASDDIHPLPWNPVVNGITITNGRMSISIPAGSTQTLTITAQNLQTGFATITPTAPSDTDQTSFVEGTLIYHFLSGDTIIDSIGIQPSSQIYMTTIPFDDLSTIALAYREKGVRIKTEDILKANPGLKEKNLQPGQKIFIPAPEQ